MSRAELLQIIAALVGALGAVIGAAESRLIRRFQKAGASSDAHPIQLGKIRPITRWRLKRLMSAGAIVPVDDAAYFLDSDRFARLKRQRRKRALFILGMLTAVFLVLYFILDVF